MTWIFKRLIEDAPEFIVFTRVLDGVERETLSLEQFVTYTNNLEDALLIVAAQPRLAHLIHDTVRRVQHG